MPLRNMFIIRTALMTGVFLFAAIAYFGPRFGIAPDVAIADFLGTLRYVHMGFIALAVGGSALMRSQLDAAPPPKQSMMLIIGWALGEAAALFGVVLYMGGGGLTPFSLGLMTFVFTLVLLPIPRPRR